MIHALLNHWAGGILSWLWGWVKCLSYWFAAIGGIGSFAIYIVTKDRKYATFTAAAIIIYIMIAAAGSVV